MSRVWLRFICATACLAVGPMHADSFVWTGAGGDSVFSNPANWESGLLPRVVGGSAPDVTFAGPAPLSVVLDGPLGFKSLTFAGGETDPAFYSLAGSSMLSLTSGLTVGSPSSAGATAQIGADISLVVANSQTWKIDGQRLQIDGSLSSLSLVFLTKTGNGDLALTGNNTLLGFVTINDGTLRVATAEAAGTAVLDIKSGAGLSGTDNASQVTIGNTVVLRDGATLGEAADLDTPNHVQLTFTNASLAASSSTLSLASGSQTTFSGLNGASGGSAVTFTGGGSAVLVGVTGFTHSVNAITADAAAVVFGNSEALPQTSVQAANGGYVGIAGDFADALLAQITDPLHFDGTIGFDSDPADPQHRITLITRLIDLSIFGPEASGFSGLGSGTTAILGSSASILLAHGTNYRFGGGGGRLVVETSLSDQHGEITGIDVRSRHYADASNDRPLTVVLQGENTFTGNLFVENSFVILDSSAALPTDSKILLGPAGYLGSTEHWGRSPEGGGPFVPHSPADLLFDLDAAQVDPTAMVGFDSSAPASVGRRIHDPIDLSILQVGSGPGALPYLGTTTFGEIGDSGMFGLELAGTISVADGMILKLAGVNGGRLLVSSTLSPDNDQHITQVVVGHPTSYRLGANGTVSLTGDNTYAGGTTLLNGTLELSTSSQFGDGYFLSGPIGTGTLTIGDGTGNDVRLFARDDILLANAITFTAGSVLRLESPRDGESFDLEGPLAGSGKLFIHTDTTLGADNCGFTGQAWVQGATLALTDDKALVHGSLYLDVGGRAEFLTAAPFLAGLGGGENETSRITLSADSLLTIDNSSDAEFHAPIVDASPGGNAAVRKTGAGELNLHGASTYSGGTIVDGGLLIAANDSAFGSGTVTVHANGTLGLDHDITLSNNVVLDGTSAGGTRAAVGGFGTLAPSDHTLAVGANSVISPGAKLDPNRNDPGDSPPVGTFALGNQDRAISVTFAHDGLYDWGVQDGGASDLIAITGTLTFNLDANEVFEFRITSFDSAGESGLLAGFDASAAHEWTVLTTTGTITHFDPAKIHFDASGFLNAPTGSLFSLRQELTPSGSSLVLDFNPAAVPEPSTWALLLLGAAFVGWSSLRRRT